MHSPFPAAVTVEHYFTQLVPSVLSENSAYGTKSHVQSLLEKCISRKTTIEVIDSLMLKPLSLCVQMLQTGNDRVGLTNEELTVFVTRHLRMINLFARDVIYRSSFHTFVKQLSKLVFEQLVSVVMNNEDRNMEYLKVEIMRFMFRIVQNYQQSLANEDLNMFLNRFVFWELSKSELRTGKERTDEHETLMMSIDLCRIICSHPELSKCIERKVELLVLVLKIISCTSLRQNMSNIELLECIQLAVHCSFINIKEVKSYNYVKQFQRKSDNKISSNSDNRIEIDKDLLLKSFNILLEIHREQKIKIKESTTELTSIDYTLYALIYLVALTNGIKELDLMHRTFSTDITTIICALLKDLMDYKPSKTILTEKLSLLKILRKHFQYNFIPIDLIDETVYPILKQIYTDTLSTDKAIFKRRAHKAIVKVMAAILMHEPISNEMRNKELFHMVIGNDPNHFAILLPIQSACIAIAQSQDMEAVQNLFSYSFKLLINPIIDLVNSPQTVKLSSSDLSRLLSFMDSLFYMSNIYNPAIMKPFIENASNLLLFLFKNCTIHAGISCIETYLSLCESLSKEELEKVRFEDFTQIITELLANGLRQNDIITLRKDKADKNGNLDIENELIFASLEFIETLAKKSAFFLQYTKIITTLVKCCCNRVMKEVAFEMDEEERVAEVQTLNCLLNLITKHPSFSESENINIAGQIASSYLQALLTHMKGFQLQVSLIISQELLNITKDYQHLVKQYVEGIPDSKKNVLRNSIKKIQQLLTKMKTDVTRATEEFPDEDSENSEEVYSTSEEKSEEENLKQLETITSKLSTSLSSLIQ
jgi:hypothetical protein